jgi:hypothetical protein
MGLTYTRGRDLARAHARRAAIRVGEVLLLMTSVAVLVTIAVAYGGRAAAEAVRAKDAPAPLNLNTPVTTGPDRSGARRGISVSG